MSKQRGLLYKTLVIGIIILLFGMSVVSSNNTAEVNHIYSDNQLWEPNSKDDNDTTPPVTNISLNGTLSEHGIYSTPVEITLNATDDLSGVNVTYYDIGDGDEIYVEPFWEIEQGGHCIIYRSVDNAGNIENWKHVNFQIDLYPPHIGLAYEILENKSIRFIPSVYDNGSGVYKVEFYINNEYKHTDYWNDSFGWIWDPPFWGHYYVVGIAYDSAEHTGQDELDITFPRSILDINQWYQYFSERFPLLEVLLRILNL